MKKFTKTLSIVLLVAMCMSMFTISSFADGSKCFACDGDLVLVEKTEPSCFAPGEGSEGHNEWTTLKNGNIKCYKCESCDIYFSDASGAEAKQISYNNDVVVKASHDFIEFPKVAASCTTEGSWGYKECQSCGAIFSLKDGRALTEAELVIKIDSDAHNLEEEWHVKTPATNDAPGVKIKKCLNNCGYEETFEIPQLEPENTEDFVVTQIDGKRSYEYAEKASFSYNVVGGPVTEVTANDISIDFSVNSAGDRVTILAGDVASINSATIYLVFSNGSDTYSGLTISRSDKVETEDIEVSGLNVDEYVKGTNVAVNFRTNVTDNVKVYSRTTRTDVTSLNADDFVYDAYYDMYTYLFDNDYLDKLASGTYEIRVYTGNSNSHFVPVGTLTISDPNTNVDDVLYFVNSTQGDNKYFKYISGDEVPRMYCELFLIDGARLQVSTNGGKSWGNVGVFNYKIELNSKNNTTSHAWIGSAYLNTLSADNYYYFRVLVPASENGTNSDWVSNPIRISTGPTLKAVDTNKHVINSSKNLKFVCSEAISEVYVGGRNLAETDPDAFKISADGKYVTLYADFLNDRTAGSTYTLSVLTKSGEKLSTTFQILTTAQASASPRTGDDSNIALWSAFLLMSGAAVVAVLPRLKKED